jgi:hypothetical protein
MLDVEDGLHTIVSGRSLGQRPRKDKIVRIEIDLFSGREIPKLLGGNGYADWRHHIHVHRGAIAGSRSNEEQEAARDWRAERTGEGNMEERMLRRSRFRLCLCVT